MITPKRIPKRPVPPGHPLLSVLMLLMLMLLRHLMTETGSEITITTTTLLELKQSRIDVHISHAATIVAVIRHASVLSWHNCEFGIH